MSRSTDDIYDHQTSQETTYQLYGRASTCPLSVGVARPHRAVLSDVGRYATAEHDVAANDCASVAHNCCIMGKFRNGELAAVRRPFRRKIESFLA